MSSNHSEVAETQPQDSIGCSDWSAPLQELINALVRSGRYIEANPHEAAVMGEDYTGSTASVFEKVLTTPPDWIDYSDMVPTIDDLRAMSQKLVNMGLWKESPEDLASFIDTRFVKKTVSATK